jgi:signal transduction protein with GAF and PtsI domain
MDEAADEMEQLRFTDEEREALEWAARQLANIRADGALATLRSLLERTRRERTGSEASPQGLTITQEVEAMPASSAGAGPVAWLAHSDEWQMVSLFRGHADAAAEENDGEVVPLYLHPTLTDEERDVLDRVANDAAYRRMHLTERVVRGLLGRLECETGQ